MRLLPGRICDYGTVLDFAHLDEIGRGATTVVGAGWRLNLMLQVSLGIAEYHEKRQKCKKVAPSAPRLIQEATLGPHRQAVERAQSRE